jgi:hypothetical protein
MNIKLMFFHLNTATRIESRALSALTDSNPVFGFVTLNQLQLDKKNAEATTVTQQDWRGSPLLSAMPHVAKDKNKNCKAMSAFKRGEGKEKEYQSAENRPEARPHRADAHGSGERTQRDSTLSGHCGEARFE